MQLLFMVLCLLPTVVALYPYGISVGDTKLTGNNSTAISLDPPFPFYGRVFDFVRVYRDGFVAFQDDTTKIDSHYVDEKPILVPIIGPWISRISTKADDDNFNVIFFRLTNDDRILTNVSEFAMKYQDFSDLFVAKYVLIVTWENVITDSFDEQPMSAKSNTFQLAIATDGSKSFCNFQFDRIEWIFFDDYNLYNFYDISDLNIKTQIGFYKGDNVNSYILPASLKTHLFDVSSESNAGKLGLYAFRVDTVPTNLTLPASTAASISQKTSTATVYASSGIATTVNSPSSDIAFSQTSVVDAAATEELNGMSSSVLDVTYSFSYIERQETTVTESLYPAMSTISDLVFQSLTNELQMSYSELSTSSIFTSSSISSYVSSLSYNETLPYSITVSSPMQSNVQSSLSLSISLPIDSILLLSTNNEAIYNSTSDIIPTLGVHNTLLTFESSTKLIAQETIVTESIYPGMSTMSDLVINSLSYEQETSYSDISTSSIFTSQSISSDVETSLIVATDSSPMQAQSEISFITNYVSLMVSLFSELSPDDSPSSLSFIETVTFIANTASPIQSIVETASSVATTTPLDSTMSETYGVVNPDSTPVFIPNPTIGETYTTSATTYGSFGSTNSQQVLTSMDNFSPVVFSTFQDFNSSPTLNFLTPPIVTDTLTTTVSFKELTATDVSWHLVSTSDIVFVSKRSNEPIATNSGTDTSAYAGFSVTQIIYPEDTTTPAVGGTKVENVEDVVIGVATTCGLVALAALGIVGILLWRISRRNRVSSAPDDDDCNRNIPGKDMITIKLSPPANHQPVLKSSRPCSVISITRTSSSRPFVT